MDQQTQTKLLRELSQIKGNEVHNLLLRRLSQHQEELSRCRDEIQLRWLQGQILEVKNFINEIETAREKLTKLEHGRPSMSKAF